MAKDLREGQIRAKTVTIREYIRIPSGVMQAPGGIFLFPAAGIWLFGHVRLPEASCFLRHPDFSLCAGRTGIGSIERMHAIYGTLSCNNVKKYWS